MRRQALSAGGWLAAACLIASVAWSCSGSDTNPFANGRREQVGSGGTSGASGGGTSGSSSGTDSGSSGSGGTSGSSGASTGGEATGGMTTGGSTGDGGAAADSGNDSGGSTAGGSAGMGGAGGTPSGGAGAGGSPMGGAGASAGAGMSGGGVGGGGMSGTGGMPGDCKEDGDCNDDEYCKKESCNAEFGHCEERGPECRGYDAEFDPVCGCDGITYWNTCVIEHEGFNVAMAGECTGNDRPTCTRTGGGDSCPPREHAHCYRPVEMCGDPSPTMGFCWVLPAECPDFEPQDQRYCGGTAGEARCIGLCEVIDAENSFRRDAPTCD